MSKDDFDLVEKKAAVTKSGKKVAAITEGPPATDKIVEDVRLKMKKIEGFDQQIQRSGFLVFKDRVSKLKMMSSPLFLFGMKLFR